MGGRQIIVFPVLYFILIPAVTGHGYIKSWAADDHQFQKAQKQPLSDTAFRSAPSNIGWIGSHFINSPAIVCGASETPKETVAAPGGTLFSAADQSAKKTLAVNAGSKVTLIVAGNEGEGFPHPTGHMLAYLGYCGKSSTACQDFDASKTDYHRIQAEVDGIPAKLRKHFDSEHDGHRWEVPIPKNIVDGSYILRIEMISFGQSSGEEGHQDQYYVFCGQIAVKGGSGSRPIPDDDHPTVKLPGAYKPGNIDPKSLPTPLKSTTGSSTHDSKPKSKAKSSDNESEETQSDDSSDSHDKEASGGCGARCYKKKMSELNQLAPTCSADETACLCDSHTFLKAYQSCCVDHCQTARQTRAAINHIHTTCDSAPVSDDGSQ
ncbi:hypothetical protein PGTUg99_013396 [Puccinia graminis f. sp. tritici]|uniref:lytic cellulose monooxygenase (C4-dehydrogenating) n=1 Tax=Puccinia graminis f. sp. tritici TaxID=56615 RepID=A0A5B0N023_PUCGR|nr:hypothetical protein PGTUg99_013396 [Puccinia graminis f. sp. tritici]